MSFLEEVLFDDSSEEATRAAAIDAAHSRLALTVIAVAVVAMIISMLFLYRAYGNDPNAIIGHIFTGMAEHGHAHH